MANPVNLTFHVSSALLGELTANGSGNGVYAYLWNNQPTVAGANFTSIVLNGVKQGGTADSNPGFTDWIVPLTTDSVANQISGGKVYLLIQSDPLPDTSHIDLTTAIGSTEGAINPTNAVAWNFGYDTFEVALKNNTADVADLTSINSFGHALGISVKYSDGTVGARGYSPAYSAAGMVDLINTTSSNQPAGLDAVLPYPATSTASTWANPGMIAITPATDQALPGGSSLPNAWQASDWTAYTTAVGALTDIELVGHFNGAKDGSGIYHNSGYFAYTVQMKALQAGIYGAAGNYFVLAPAASSQIQGYVVIGQQNLMNNLYSPGLSGPGTSAYVFSDAKLTTPFNIDGASPTGEMNTGANNQWGAVFTQFFTGFSGGYFGGTGKSIPTVNNSPFAPTYSVDLDQNFNWDPTYAFDGARSNTIAAAQHFDPYAQIYFAHTNVYGGAYSDALTTNFTTSVTLPVWSTPGSTNGSNVSNIDLWGFGSNEAMTTVPGTGTGASATNFYQPNSIDNYLAPPAGTSDYSIDSSPAPAAPGASPNFGPNNVSINLANNGMLVDPTTAAIQLGIYLGNGAFQYMPIPSGAAQNGGGYWQQWQITQDTTKAAGSQFAISSIPIPANPAAGNPGSAFTPGSFGTLTFASFPTVANGTSWYQLIVAGKTFNFYAETDGSSNVTDVAADGLAVITSTTANLHTFTLAVIPGSMDALGSAAMIPNTDASYLSTLPHNLSAPVAGTLSGAVLQPLQTTAGQSTDFNSTLSLTTSTALAFGWTGLSTAAGKAGWISALTNKINPGDTAQINFVDTKTSKSVGTPLTAVADVDGQWQTTSTAQFGGAQFGNGSYAVTMTELLPNGSVYGVASSALTITVNVATLQDTGAAFMALSPRQHAALAATGVSRLDALDNALSLSVAHVQALGTVMLTAADIVTLADTGRQIARLTAADLAAMNGQHIDRIDATNDVLQLTVAQYQALGSMTLTGSDMVVLKDTGANLAALEPRPIAALAGKGIDRLDASDNALSLSAAQISALGAVDLTQSDTVTLADTGRQIARLTAADLAAMNGQHIDRIDATNDVLPLTVAQYQALGSMTLTGSDMVVLKDTGANLAALSVRQIAALAGKGIDRLDASDNALSLSVAQLRALGAVALTPSDTVTLADTGARIGALPAPEVAALAGQGIDRIDATNGALSLGLAQFAALGKAILAADDVLRLTGTAADDRLEFSRQTFSGLDRIDGGAGNDTLVLNGDYAAGLAFQATTLANVEAIALGAGHSYGLTLADGNLGAGQTLSVSAIGLGVLQSLVFDGLAEANGRFKVSGGAGNDTFTGGRGADGFSGGGGSDLFRYTDVAQSTGATYDTIAGFDGSLDRLHVWNGVTAVDAPIVGGTLSAASFDTDLAAAVNATNLSALHAAIFSPSTGSLAGQSFLVVDVNNVAGYQARADLVIHLAGASNLAGFGTANFA